MGRILVIEDQPLWQKALSRMLKRAGHLVVPAGSPSEANAYLIENEDIGMTYDLILLNAIFEQWEEKVKAKDLLSLIEQANKSRRARVIVFSKANTPEEADEQTRDLLRHYSEIIVDICDKKRFGDGKKFLEFVAQLEIPTAKEDWGNMPDISPFFGRIEELATLDQWIIQDHHPVVAILGMKGIGKTKVAVRLVKGGIVKTDQSTQPAYSVRREFKYIIWRGLINAPPISELLGDLIRFLSDQQETVLPEAVGERISRMLQYMQQQRCLVILDNLEAVLREGEEPGEYKEDYEGYGELIRRVIDTPHQSCLLLTSREKPKDIPLPDDMTSPARALELSGLDELDARRIFHEIGTFSGSDEEWSDLIRLYSGNPLALELVAKHISREFFGNITKFLRDGRQFFGDFNDLLGWHFQRLSNSQKEILYWLAISREPMSRPEIATDILSPVSRKQLHSNLQGLRRRIPIEKSASRFTLQPVLMEYVTNQFIRQIREEITTGQIALLNTHALLKALAKDYVRESQIRLIVNPLRESLVSVLGSQSNLDNRLKHILSSLRDKAPLTRSYAGGGILNLLCQAHPELRGYDFSHLEIWHAYLQETGLHDVNFRYSNFQNCVFIQTFGPIPSLAFSPDGKYLAASESNGRIHIWRLADLQIVSTLSGHLNWVFALAFSPDGLTLASGGEDKTVRLWNAQNGTEIRALHGHENSVWSVAFSPQGDMLATGSEDETIKIWDPETGQCVSTLTEHERKIFSVTFSPDGTKLASASADHTVKVWDTKDWSRSKTLLGHTDTVRGAVFSPDSQFIASASWDRTVRVWDAETGECINILRGHVDRIHAVAFGLDGDVLASSSESGAIRIWDLPTGKCQRVLQRHNGEVWTIAFSPDGQSFASGGYDGLLRIWDTQDWRCRNTLQGYTDWVQAVSISSDDRVVASTSADLAIRLWDVDTGNCLNTLHQHTGWTFAIVYGPEGRLLASGSDDRTIKVWDARNWSCLNVLQGHTSWVQAVAFSPDGRLLASGSDDRTAKIWDLDSGLCLRTLEGHAEGIWSVLFGLDGKTVVTGSEDQTIRAWDISTGQCLRLYQGHGDRVHSIALSPDGNTVASSSDDRTVRLWNFNTGSCLSVLEGHTSWVISVAFSPNGQRLASGGKDQTVRIWDARSGSCLKVLHGHTGGIWSVTFSHDGKTVITGSEDGCIKIWDAEAGNCLTTIRPPKPYEGTNITGVTGLTLAQKASLKLLGAIESE